MSRSAHRRAWMGYLHDATELEFSRRFAKLLRHWVQGLPSQCPGTGYLSMHRAVLWQEWVLSPLLSIRQPELPAPPSLPEGLLQPFDDADPWRQSAPLAEIFLAVQRKRLRPAERRRRGLVFTPRAVAAALVAQLEPLVQPPISEPLRILDPAAGGGMFWEALIAQRLANLDPLARPAVYADLLLTHLFAIERDPLLAALIDVRARAGWYSYQLLQSTLAASEPPEPPESLVPQVARFDTLERDRYPARWPTRFDVVIGNPPYGFAEAIPGEELSRLLREYEVARGAFDRSWVFIERGIELLAADGVLAYLIPDALLVRPRARNLRRLIARHTTLLETTSVGTIFPGAQVGGAFLLARKRFRPEALLPDESTQKIDALFRRHLYDAVPVGTSGLRLGDLCTISRGEELGIGACRPLGEDPQLRPILRGRDLSMLGLLQMQVGIAGPVSKPAVIYGAPKIMVVKTGAAPIIALDLTEGVATLQSIYNVHLRNEAPAGIALPLIAWLLACAEGQTQFRQFTAGKTLFPQLNQHMLAAFQLPDVARLQALGVQLLETCPEFVATGVLGPGEQEAIQRIGP